MTQGYRISIPNLSKSIQQRLLTKYQCFQLETNNFAVLYLRFYVCIPVHVCISWGFIHFCHSMSLSSFCFQIIMSRVCIVRSGARRSWILWMVNLKTTTLLNITTICSMHISKVGLLNRKMNTMRPSYVINDSCTRGIEFCWKFNCQLCQYLCFILKVWSTAAWCWPQMPPYYWQTHRDHRNTQSDRQTDAAKCIISLPHGR